MRYLSVFLAAMLLTACASQNEEFYEIWKPRYIKVVDPTQTSNKSSEQNPTEESEPVEADVIKVSRSNPVYVGVQFLDYTEKEDRRELKELTGVDPVRVEWCAAFANAILEKSNIPSNKDHKYALTARAFLDWGEAVEEPEMGDIVVFPRGDQGWQGHVGFFVKQQVIDDELYYYILGGNQKNSVNVTIYPAAKALGVRRYIDDQSVSTTSSGS